MQGVIRARARAHARQQLGGGTLRDTFDHGKMDVYQVAIEFIALADEVAKPMIRWPGVAMVTETERPRYIPARPDCERLMAAS
jgi:hypothetical protein